MDAFLFRLPQIVSVCRRKGGAYFPNLIRCVERSFICSYTRAGRFYLHKNKKKDTLQSVSFHVSY